jgi:putative transposase
LAQIQQQHPDQVVELWCQDESRIGQKGSRTRSWAPRGRRPTAPVDTRYANAYLFGAFCPQRDTGVALVLPAANTEMMQLHLDTISAQLPTARHAAMVVDRASWHVTTHLTVPLNITLIPLPATAPDLNPAEKVWQFLKANFLSARVFETYEDIVEATCDAWQKLRTEPGRIKSLTSYHSTYPTI